MISKEDKLYITRYYDIYGMLLSPRALAMLKMYYDNDMSLAEIADEYNVTRQAVRDTIVRAEEQLLEYDKALGLINIYENISSKCNEIIASSSECSSENVAIYASEIKEIIKQQQ